MRVWEILAMSARYSPNRADESLINNITENVKDSLEEWYGMRSQLGSSRPDILSFQNSFMLRYPLTTPPGQTKHVLVKIRRNPKMDTLYEAIQADIHRNVRMEYESLQFVYDRISPADETLGAIRPLSYFEQYHAIAMEEYPSRTLRQILNHQRTSRTNRSLCELKDAAWKTGRWLYYFHQIHTPTETAYTTVDILQEVQAYAERIEDYSRKRVLAGPILDSFSKKLKHISIHRLAFSQSHADMTIDNVLYSDDHKICVVDIKTRLAPIYADLGLVLIHPETSRREILFGGRYYPDSVLREYRAQIIAGYFEEKPGMELLAQIYSATKVLDKWLMYEELLHRYNGVKHLLSIPARPWISRYFTRLLNKHLGLIGRN